MANVQRAEFGESGFGARAREFSLVIPFLRPKRRPAEPPSAMALEGLIATAVLPRLLAAHPDAENGRWVDADFRVACKDVAHFTELMIFDDVDALRSHVECLRARGAGADTLRFDLFAPAAKLAGFMLDEGLCGPADAAAGLNRLAAVIEDLGHGVGDEVPSLRASHDERATGSMLTREFFTRSGWRVESAPVSERSQ